MKKKTMAFILTAAALTATAIVAAKKQKEKKEEENALQATLEEGEDKVKEEEDACKGQEECICRHSCHCHPVKEAEPVGEDEAHAITLPSVEEIVENVLPDHKKKQKCLAAQILVAHRDYRCASWTDDWELIFEIGFCDYLGECGVLKELVDYAKTHDVATSDLNAILDSFLGTEEETCSLWEKIMRYMDIYTA